MNRWNEVYIYKIFDKDRIGIWKTGRKPTEIQRDFLCKSVRTFDTFRFNIESFDSSFIPSRNLGPRFIEIWLCVSSKKKKKSTLETPFPLPFRVFSPSFRGSDNNSVRKLESHPFERSFTRPIFDNIISRIMIF